MQSLAVPMRAEKQWYRSAEEQSRTRADVRRLVCLEGSDELGAVSLRYKESVFNERLLLCR